jgi:indolepyruvate ferredoxin oxidoreductase alpha subunit
VPAHPATAEFSPGPFGASLALGQRVGYKDVEMSSGSNTSGPEHWGQQRMHELLTDESGKSLLLLGNEAIVRGAMEAGVAVAAAYPGTPSSEIADNLFQLAQEPAAGIYFEFSTNEKVAMEVTAAAAAAGVRSLTCMKHVGMNVAADVLISLAYLGTKAGMVIVSADDPSLHSSQNEQDNRMYAKLAQLPMLEPSSPQEAKDMTVAAFDLSESLELPVIIRTTTRTAHLKGPVKLGTLPQGKMKRGAFQGQSLRWIAFPTSARERHKVLLGQMDKAAGYADSSLFNRVQGSGSTGVLASGVSSCYVADALEDLGCRDLVTFLRLGFTYPQPRELLLGFLRGVDRVLVVEELEPFQEEALKALAQEAGLTMPILGKASGHLPRLYELNPVQVREAIATVLNLTIRATGAPDLSALPPLPTRLPTLCDGCPHRETFEAVKEALTILGLEEKTIHPTDIGCYTLGILPPIEVGDYLLCMGSSVGTSAGFAVATDQRIVSFIGDSTFFHSGIPPLINAVHNNHRFCLVILDNSTTAMTGHQPNPGTKLAPAGYHHPRIPIEQIVRGCGVTNVVRIDPYQRQTAVATIVDVLATDELSVVIAERPCVLYARHKAVGAEK